MSSAGPSSLISNFTTTTTTTTSRMSEPDGVETQK
jgi:hypothetical protein